jgi:hypothetical protein
MSRDGHSDLMCRAGVLTPGILAQQRLEIAQMQRSGDATLTPWQRPVSLITLTVGGGADAAESPAGTDQA